MCYNPEVAYYTMFQLFLRALAELHFLKV